jgi:hypothetical protein
MKDIAQLAEYYGIPEMPIRDFISIPALRRYLGGIRYTKDSVDSEFVIVQNVSRPKTFEISEDGELEGLKFDYFDEFRAIVARAHHPGPYETMRWTFNEMLGKLLDEKVKKNDEYKSEYGKNGGCGIELEGGSYCPS